MYVCHFRVEQMQKFDALFFSDICQESMERLLLVTPASFCLIFRVLVLAVCRTAASMAIENKGHRDRNQDQDWDTARIFRVRGDGEGDRDRHAGDFHTLTGTVETPGQISAGVVPYSSSWTENASQRAHVGVASHLSFFSAGGTLEEKRKKLVELTGRSGEGFAAGAAPF